MATLHNVGFGMTDNDYRSRRGFLRVALGASLSGAALKASGRKPAFAQASPEGPAALQVGELTLDRDVYDWGGVLNGALRFRRAPDGPTEILWIDSFGRTAGALTFPIPASLASPLRFSFNLDSGLAYSNWIYVKVNGVPQLAGAKFLLSPPPDRWDEYQVISWAHYPDGFYGQLREAGVDGTIAERDGDFSYILDNNFRFYVEQMTWEIFSIYIKRREHWYSVVNQFSADRENLKLWVRKPCLNDPKTNEYVREHITRYVRQHKAFRPLYYNIADELGEGWQIKPQDFCHSEYCTAKFAEYLRRMYAHPRRVSQEWQTNEFTRWDDATHPGTLWDEKNLMIACTTTDRAFDAVAAAGFQAKFGSVSRLKREWAVPLAEPAPEAASLRDRWEPLLAIIRETRSVPDVTEEALARKLGSLAAANERWGRGAEKPAAFQSWVEVASLDKRFYAELAAIRSTEGWNVTPWCDFRNFMDETFADAVGRAAAVCKSEDPAARCATEGGQSPFPFGWYNYEQVLRVDDVIEPYNGGNNVEIIRSLKPETIMVSTHDYAFKAGKPLTAQNRRGQQEAVQPVWWGLFHAHRGTLIWDDNLPQYQFVDPQTGQLTPAAEAFAATFKELREGIGKLFINARRVHPGIAIYYSPPSDQIHWLLDNLRHAREWMLRSGSDHGSHAIAVRNSWTKVIEDLGLQYDFASTLQVKAGILSEGRYRVFIMPQAMAVSAGEAELIREFVRAGGLLVADSRCATMNEHGRDLGRGQLDDVFGITHAKGQPGGSEVRGVAGERPLSLQGKLLKVSAANDTIAVTEGKALARSGSAPLVIVNRFGKGRAIFLNMEVGEYCYQRLRPNPSSSLPELIEGILSVAGIKPVVRVLGEDGGRLPGTEVVTFANGPLEHVAIFRNPQFDDAGWEDNPTIPIAGRHEGRIDNSLLSTEAAVTINWQDARYTYDVRGRRQLGALRMLKADLKPFEPLVFTRSPQPVSPLRLDILKQAATGATLELRLAADAELPQGSFRVVRLDFFTPAGTPYDLYSRNVFLSSVPQTERIPLALNDPTGAWRVCARDVATGETQEKTFSVV
ncbi:MAG: beta-galactosidase trimerization domain-containing protein [Terriglobia bacterium]